MPTPNDSHASPVETALRALVTGRVQGVFFRASTRDEATRLGVRGWVRNLPGGQVEAHLEGAPAAVEQLVRWLRKGPPMARVDRLETEPREPEGLYSDFRVTR